MTTINDIQTTPPNSPADVPGGAIHSTVNINAAISLMLKIIDSVQQAFNLLLYNNAQNAADASQRETDLNNYFYQCEHSATNPIASGQSSDNSGDPGVSDPNDAYWKFQNSMWALSNDTSSGGSGGPATLWGPVYNDDNARLQTGIKALDALNQMWQTQESANANNQSLIVQMGASIANQQQSVSRLLG